MNLFAFIKVDKDGNILTHHHYAHDGIDVPNNNTECLVNLTESEDTYNIYKFRYDLINKKLAPLTKEEMRQHPNYKIREINKKIDKLKKKEEKIQHKRDWENIKKQLIDLDEINEVQKRIDNLDKE